MARRVRVERAALVAAALALTVAAVPVLPAAPASAADPTVSAAQARSGEWWLSKLGITQAWAKTRGAGVTVAVLDSGVDATHPDLRGAVSGGKDFSGKGASNGQRAVAGEPHGTAMAGYIAGRGHGAGNKLGLIGVAPEAKLLSVSAGFINSGDDIRADPHFNEGLRWAVDHGATVVNMSFGGGAIGAADIAYAQAHDVVLVGASGNGGSSAGVDNPAGFMGVVAVGGVDADLSTDTSANRGEPVFLDDSSPPSQGLGALAVAGPYADRHSRTDGNAPVDGMVGLTLSGYQRADGTSNGTAVVSGIVALIRSEFPAMKAPDVVNRLIQTSRQVNPARSGWSSDQGFGVPNAYRALTVDLPKVCENPLGSLTEPASFGIWKSIKNNTKYEPKCAGGGASSTAPSTGSSDGSQSAPQSGSSSGSSSSVVAAPGSGSDSGVPVWVWPVAAVVVLALVAMLVLARRRSRPAGHGGPPGGFGPPGGYGGPGYGPPGRG